MEVVGDRLVDLRDRPSWARMHAGEITEVVDGQRQVDGGRFPDRLAVVPGLGAGQQFEVRLDPVSDRFRISARSAGAGAAPGIRGGMGGIKGRVDVCGVGTGDLHAQLPFTGEKFSKYWPFAGGSNLPPMKLPYRAAKGAVAVCRKNSILFIGTSRPGDAAGMRRREIKLPPGEDAPVSPGGSGPSPAALSRI